jgi:hypothetical protein
MPPYAASDGIRETGTYDTHLVREVRSFCLSRAHLNPFAIGRSESLRRKKLAAIKPLAYRDVINAVRIARREGNRRGQIGAQMAAAIVNAIIFDSLEPGEQPDIVAVPRAPETVAASKSPEAAELEFARAHVELHHGLIECVGDRQLDEKEIGWLRRLKASFDRNFGGVMRAYGVGE